MKTNLITKGKLLYSAALLMATNITSFAQTTPCTTPLVVDVQSQDPLCFGDNNGWIDLNISGGTPAQFADPYKVTWNQSGFNGMNQLNNLSSGIYKVIITDSVGCAFTATISLQEPPELVIDETHINPSQLTSGSIDLSVTGGAGNYVYEWNNGATSQDLNNLQSGLYDITVTDANGCEREDTIELTFTNKIISGIYGSTIGNNASNRELGDVIILYPNPSPGSLMIAWGDLDVKTVRVLRNDGFVDKFKKISNQQRLEFNDLPSGAYRVYLSTFSGATITKSLQVIN
jgi:hypothetical protein